MHTQTVYNVKRAFTSKIILKLARLGAHTYIIWRQGTSKYESMHRENKTFSDAIMGEFS